MMWMGGDTCVARSCPMRTNRANGNGGRRKRLHPASAQPRPYGMDAIPAESTIFLCIDVTFVFYVPFQIMWVS